MGADFIFSILPACELTEARMSELSKLIAAAKLDEDYTDQYGNPPVVENYLELFNSREVGMMTLENVKYLITGGMSWGDGPTDAYELMSSFDAIPEVFDTLLRWSKEDFVSHLL